jgi:hypothetical protein
MQKINVSKSPNTELRIHNLAGNLCERGKGSIFLLSNNKFQDFFVYMKKYTNHKLCIYEGCVPDDAKVYAHWGSYIKTRGAKSEVYDSMNLRHNGWMEMALSPITGPSIGPGKVLGDVATYAECAIDPKKLLLLAIEKSVGKVILKENYFLVITQSSAHKCLHGSVKRQLFYTGGSGTTIGKIRTQLCHFFGKDPVTGKNRGLQ